MSYKIGSNTAISNTGISNYSIPFSFNIADTQRFMNVENAATLVVGDGRMITSNGSHIITQYLNSTDNIATPQYNASGSFATVAIGDGLIVVGDPFNNDLNVNAGITTVYGYDGVFKYALYPSTNVAANVNFGHTVSVRSNLISVCSRESNAASFNRGTIYVYYSNGTLKSKTFRPINPQVTSTAMNNFRGVLIDGYRILAFDETARSSNTAVNNAGAIYMFATDNTHIFTANQQVDIGQDDYFGSTATYGDGIIHVGSPEYESQVAPFPLNDGLVTGFSLQGDLVYRYDPGAGSHRGTYIATGGGYVAIGGYYSRYIELLTSKGQYIQTLTMPLADIPYFNMHIYNNTLYIPCNNGIYYYDLPQSHNSYYSNIIKNKKRYY